MAWLALCRVRALPSFTSCVALGLGVQACPSMSLGQDRRDQQFCHLPCGQGHLATPTPPFTTTTPHPHALPPPPPTPPSPACSRLPSPPLYALRAMPSFFPSPVWCETGTGWTGQEQEQVGILG